MRFPLWLLAPFSSALLSFTVLSGTTCPTVVNCGEGEFGCVQPGHYCCDTVTGAGACANLMPLGPCVCDPSDNPPPPTGPDPDDWSSGGATPDPQDPCLNPPCPDVPSYVDIGVGRESGPCHPLCSLKDAPAPFPQIGDVVCAYQSGTASFRHAYNVVWGPVPSELVAITSSRFCFRVVGQIDSDWWLLEVQEFQATMPSFTPAALPGHPTGENHVVLDIVGSKGKLYAPTYEVFFEFNLRLTNTIFNADYPAPVRVGARGTMHPSNSTLTMTRMTMDAMTPAGYRGVRP